MSCPIHGHGATARRGMYGTGASTTLGIVGTSVLRGLGVHLGHGAGGHPGHGLGDRLGLGAGDPPGRGVMVGVPDGTTVGHPRLVRLLPADLRVTTRLHMQEEADVLRPEQSITAAMAIVPAKQVRQVPSLAPATWVAVA